MRVDQCPFITKISRYVYEIQSGEHLVSETIDMPVATTLRGSRGSLLRGESIDTILIRCHGFNTISDVATKGGQTACFNIINSPGLVRIIGCKFEDTALAAIWCESQSITSIINTIIGDTNDNGIQIQGAKLVTLINCLFVGNYGNSAINSVHFPVTSFIMEHCTIVSKNGYGVRLKNIGSVILGNNLVICPTSPGDTNGYAFRLEECNLVDSGGNAGIGASTIPFTLVGPMFMNESSSSPLDHFRPSVGLVEYGMRNFFVAKDITEAQRIPRPITCGCLERMQ